MAKVDPMGLNDPLSIVCTLADGKEMMVRSRDITITEESSNEMPPSAREYQVILDDTVEARTIKNLFTSTGEMVCRLPNGVELRVVDIITYLIPPEVYDKPKIRRPCKHRLILRDGRMAGRRCVVGATVS